MLKIGDKIKDNDPRRTYERVLTISSVGTKEVSASDDMRNVRISLKRIHTDGKQRRSGFSLIIP